MNYTQQFKQFFLDSLEEGIIDVNTEHLAHWVLEDEFRNYFTAPAGKEHYKLLADLSFCFDNVNFLEIGTYKGLSALALAYNLSNRITSWDIGDFLSIFPAPENVEFKIGNVLKEENLNNFLFIFLDTFHDGSFEDEFYKHLKEINYKGVVMLDDIHLNEPMKKFWDSITEEKYDITSIGHWSGTGIVIFE
jgi:hypothetical protein